MKKNKKLIIIPVVLIILGIGVFFGVKKYLELIKVEQVFTEKTYELGDVEVSEVLTDYITTSNYMLKKSVLDISQVRKEAVGEYVVTCDAGKNHFEYKIIIEDTTDPEISFGNIDMKFGTFSDYSLADLKVDVTDYSEISRTEIISYQNASGEKVEPSDNSFCIEEPGNYTFEVAATDACGNSSSKSLTIEILESPHFVLLNDRKYIVGSDYDEMEFVYAKDRFGNDITDGIEVEDNGGFDAEVPGEYTVKYSVTDEEGLSRHQSIQIMVGDFKRSNPGFELDETNMTELIFHDYFTYEPLTGNTDPELVKTTVERTSFGMKCNYTYTDQWGFASCFIYKITPTNVYFVTNKHCDAIFKELSPVTLIDYDDNLIKIDVDKVQRIKCSDRDLMVFVIPTECFDADLLLTYKEALIDWDVYDRMKVGDTLITSSQAWGRTEGVIEDIVNVSVIDSFSATEYHGDPFYYPSVTTEKAVIKKGQSGSASFNIEGYYCASVYALYPCWCREPDGRYLTPHGYKDAYIRIGDVQKFLNTVEIE